MDQFGLTGGNIRMSQLAAGRPFYETTWLAAGSVILFLIFLGTVLPLMIMVTILATNRIRGNAVMVLIAGWLQRTTAIVLKSLIRRIPKPIRWIMIGIASCLTVLAALVFYATTINFGGSHVIVSGGGGPPPVPQTLLQERLSKDEQALDKGVLTYPALPTLKTGLPTNLTVTVMDAGKSPQGSKTITRIASLFGTVVYPRDVPTGGIVGLRLTCTANLYCQALSSVKQAVVGVGASQTWSWNLTPLGSEPMSATITASTYDGTTDTVLNEEIIPISLKVEKGPWWAAINDWWHAVTSFATTTAGLITTVGGAVAVMAGGIEWVRRKRSKSASNRPKRKTSHDNKRSSGRHRRGQGLDKTKAEKQAEISNSEASPACLNNLAATPPRARLRSYSGALLWLALGWVIVIAAVAIAGIVKFELVKSESPSHSGTAHIVVTPTMIGSYTRSVDLERQANMAQLRVEVIKMSSGQASDVVSAVYESDSSEGRQQRTDHPIHRRSPGQRRPGRVDQQLHAEVPRRPRGQRGFAGRRGGMRAGGRRVERRGPMCLVRQRHLR